MVIFSNFFIVFFSAFIYIVFPSFILFPSVIILIHIRISLVFLLFSRCIPLHKHLFALSSTYFWLCLISLTLLSAFLFHSHITSHFIALFTRHSSPVHPLTVLRGFHGHRSSPPDGAILLGNKVTSVQSQPRPAVPWVTRGQPLSWTNTLPRLESRVPDSRVLSSRKKHSRGISRRSQLPSGNNSTAALDSIRDTAH